MSSIPVCAVLAGCQSPEAQRQIARRHESLRRTANLLVEQEADRPENLDRTFTMLGGMLERDVQRTRRMPQTLGRIVEAEFERWIERQPAYGDAVLRELGGNPESIERTLPLMVY
jgi:hypothetical protein